MKMGKQGHVVEHIVVLLLIITQQTSALPLNTYRDHSRVPTSTTTGKNRVTVRGYLAYDNLKGRGSSVLFSTTGPLHSTPSRPRKYKGGKPLKQTDVKHMFSEAKRKEREGRWAEAASMYQYILKRIPDDAHSHLALARLQARRETKNRIPSRRRDSDIIKKSGERTLSRSNFLTKAEAAFMEGTEACPDSVHLWQAWAVYEESRGEIDRARELFQQALSKEPHNPYVCHAYGLMEEKQGNKTKAVALWELALTKHSTAALVCSLGLSYVSEGKLEGARALYATHLPRLTTEKDKVEVCLAAAWLEERHSKDYKRARELLEFALDLSPGSSLANVALSRLEGRMHHKAGSKSGMSGTKAARRRLEDACEQIEKGEQKPSDRTDGRVFNALATMEVKAHRFDKAREILQRGMDAYPLDHALFQAAGKVEERVGNFTEARRLYTESLQLEPSAPTLVAFALLELRHPQSGVTNRTFVRGLFEEALMIDPRHGAAYNAYGNAETKWGNKDAAREIFLRGVQADCSDAASLYHGYGKFELLLGNVETARKILQKGIEVVRMKDMGTDSTLRDRAKFLSHTLGLLELNSNRPVMALDIFMDGISRSGNSSQLLLGAALCEMKLGKDDAARMLFERSIMSDKKHAQAWQAWGVMETRAGNFKVAKSLFQCGIRSTPWYGPLWHGFATLEMRKGNVANARLLFAGGVKKVPKHSLLHQAWALLELREGNYVDARKLIAQALTNDKSNGSGWLIAAQIEEEQGNEGLENLLLRRGIECAPNSAELYNKLGENLVSRGQIANARQVYEKGIELNPLHAPLYHSLAELEARVCNLEGLSRLNKRTAKLFNNNALEPSPFSSQAFGTKLRSKRFIRTLPSDVAAFAEKIVDDKDKGLGLDEVVDIDPAFELESISGNFMEDEFVGELLELDPTKGDG